jgi:hypothetical protein
MKKIVKVRAPTLIMHGELDDVIPFEHAVQLQEQCTSSHLVPAPTILFLYSLLRPEPEPDPGPSTLNPILLSLEIAVKRCVCSRDFKCSSLIVAALCSLMMFFILFV